MESAQSVDRASASRLSIAGLTLDLQHGELLDAAGRQVRLRKQALEVLLVLAARAGHVVNRDELMSRVWHDVVVTEDSLVQAIADIRRALGDRDHTLVRALPRRGYLLDTSAAQAFLPSQISDPVSGGDAGLLRAAPPTLSPLDAPPAPMAAPRRLWLVAAAVALAVALIASAWMALRGPGIAGSGPPQIAVLAFHERGHGIEDATLAAGLSEDLVRELGRNQGLNVVAHHSSFAVSGKGLTTAEIGRQLHAQYLVDGVVQRDGERLGLEVELIDVRTDKVLWVVRPQSEGGQVVEARDEIVRKVAGTLLSKMHESEKQRAAGAAPKSLDVYALTQRGLALKHRFTPDATREGRAALEHAIELDPNYGPAWWTLGYLNAVDAHLGLSGEWNYARMHEAVDQINRGIELDPYSSTAFQALKAALATGGHEEEELAAAQRAVELGPGDAEAWLFHADAVLHARPAAQALPSMQRALEMNPLGPVYFDAMYAKVLWGNGQSDAALRQAEACARRAPLFSDCRFVELLAYAERGELARAHEQIDVLKHAQYTRHRGCGSWTGSPAVVARCLELASAAELPE